MGIKRGPTNDLSSIQGIFWAMLRHGIEHNFYFISYGAIKCNKSVSFVIQLGVKCGGTEWGQSQLYDQVWGDWVET